MTTTAIRERLHHFIDTIEDKKAAAIYTLFEESIKDTEEEYTDEFKAELDRRYAAYKKDGKVITRDAMDKRINKLLGKSK
jgi:putative addiction module component (TIGR02574 family)